MLTVNGRKGGNRIRKAAWKLFLAVKMRFAAQSGLLAFIRLSLG